jgi:hypothetical protein
MARSLREESLVITRELEHKGDIAYLLHNLGRVAHRQGDAVGAGQLSTESLNMRRMIGAKLSIALSLAGLGAGARSAGQPVKGATIAGGWEGPAGGYGVCVGA